MRMRLFVFLGGILLGLSVNAQTQTVCSGTIAGPGGKRLPAAHVVLLTPVEGIAVEVAQASKEGRYQLPVPHNGFWVLRFVGVGYADQKVVLYIPSESPITLDIALGGNHYLPGNPPLYVVGDFNVWNIVNAVPLVQEKSGIYRANIPATKDSIEIRIRGYKDADGVEGVKNATYVLNRDGSYNARIKTIGGLANVVVDPRLLDRSSSRARFTFVEASDRSKRIAAVVHQWWDGEANYFAAQIDKAMKRAPLDTPVINWNSLMASLLRQENGERDTLVRSVCALAYVSTCLKARSKDVASLTKSMERLSPTSAVWGLNAGAFSAAVRRTTWSSPQREKYIHAAITDNPDRTIRVAVLYNEFGIAFNADDNAKAATYYDLLTGEYGDTSQGKLVKKDYPRPDPNAPKE